MTKDLYPIAELALAIAKRKGAAEAGARVDRTRAVELNWRDGKVETTKEATTRSLSVALYVDGRYGVMSTSDLRTESLEAFVGDAVALTRSLARDPFRSLPDPKLYEGRAPVDLDIEDGKYASVTPELRRSVAKAIEAAAREVKGADHIVSVSTSYSDTHDETVRVTSNGFRGERIATEFWAGASVSANDPDGRKPEDYFYAGSRFSGSLPDAAQIGRTAGERAIAKIGSKKPETAVLPMAVENRAAGRLVGQLLGPMSGFALQQKRSFLEGKLGTEIGSSLLSLADDPLLPRGFGSRLFDDEGITSKTRTLFDEGKLSSYFIDWYYGKKLGIAPTTGGMSNLAWKVGTKGQKEILAGMKEGIFVTSFLGGNSNGTTGDFSLGVAGFRVRGGAIAEPVVELNVAGNQLDFWKRLAAVGDDPYPYSSTRTPTLVFDNVTFAGV